MRSNRETLFRNALFTSILFHALIGSGIFLKTISNKQEKISNTIEIDLTKPFRIGGNPLLKPGGGIPIEIPKESVGIPAPTETIAPERIPAKEWLLPEINSPKEMPQPTSGPKEGEYMDTNIAGAGTGVPGTGPGWGGGEGEGGGLPLSRFPRLINRTEVLKLLKKLYPMKERRLGQEGVVIVNLHLSAEGMVQGIEIVESGGVSFDSVAKEVSKSMRFSPATVGDNPVAVKIRQSIIFQLED